MLWIFYRAPLSIQREQMYSVAFQQCQTHAEEFANPLLRHTDSNTEVRWQHSLWNEQHNKFKKFGAKCQKQSKSPVSGDISWDNRTLWPARWKLTQLFCINPQMSKPNPKAINSPLGFCISVCIELSDIQCFIHCRDWKLILPVPPALWHGNCVYRGPISTALWDSCSPTPAPLYLLNWHVKPPHCAGKVNILTSLMKWVSLQRLAGTPGPDQMGLVVETGPMVKRICQQSAGQILLASFSFWLSYILSFRMFVSISLFTDYYISDQLTGNHTLDIMGAVLTFQFFRWCWGLDASCLHQVFPSEKQKMIIRTLKEGTLHSVASELIFLNALLKDSLRMYTDFTSL